MADEYQSKSSHEYETTVVDGQGRPVETKDRGLFHFMGKKEDNKAQEEVLVTEFDQKVTVSEPEPKFGGYKEDEKEKDEKKHTSLLEKLHRSDSNSSSSSDEEEGETEEKKKKRKERKENKGLKEKITGDREEEKYEDTTIPVEKYEEETVVHHAPTVVHHSEPVQPEEKKGFLDKIKEKLPGQPKKTEEIPPPPPPQTEYAAAELPSQEGEAKEKKGFLEKIKEKLPGYHPKTEEEKEKAGGAPSPH